jgi:hypothetical protein
VQQPEKQKMTKGRDYFPPAGPVRKYKPLIISQAKWYSRKYYVNYFDVLSQAVSLAALAERKFDPTRGTFGTLLQWELQRLHRWCQRRYRAAHGPQRYGEQDWERENRKRENERRRAREVSWRDGRPVCFYLIDGKPGTYKHWKAALGREEWPAAAEAISCLPLGSDKWRGMRDWMVGDLLGLEDRTMREAAADSGITKGYASKIVCQIAKDFCVSSAKFPHAGGIYGEVRSRE